ncbi:hypothetical protein [Paenibacillus sp. FSL R5-0701]|uniref:hypothetical protein n=1 Tax=Paenibacillus sp. FSL R5-0701 TaxID=2921654 RepID=UPI0030CAACA1
MPKFRKRPVVIEAIQWTGENLDEVADMDLNYEIRDGMILIPTLEGTMVADHGDWIIKGVNGEFYPCKPDIFEKTYDPA